MTDYHTLNEPPEGLPDWDDEVNNNFRDIDRLLSIRDVDANLGMYSPKQDALYLAYDTGTLYRGDGNNWNAVQFDSPSIAQDSITSTELDLSISPTWTSSHTFQSGLTSQADISLDGNGLVNVGGTTDASSGTIRLGSGTQSINARDATTPQDFGITFDENSGSPLLAVTSADLTPDSVGSRNIGTASTYFNEMHATAFITHSPTISERLSKSIKAVRDFAERAKTDDGASGELSEMVAHLASVVEAQQAQIETLQEDTA